MWSWMKINMRFEEFKNLWKNSVGRVEIRGLGDWTGEIDLKVGHYGKLIKKIISIIKPPLPCTWQIMNMFILSNGNVCHCCGDSEGKLTIGNANKESLYSIWRSKLNKELRYKHLRGTHKRDIDICKICEAVS